MTEVFEIKEPHYNLRSEASHFKRENVKSTHYGIQSVRHLRPKICTKKFKYPKILENLIH